MARALFSVLACLAAAGPSASADTVSVMSFNLRYDNPADGSNRWNNADQDPERRAFAVTVITNYMPDLIGFQEPQDTHLQYLSNNLAPPYLLEWEKPSGGSDERAAFAYNTNKLELLDRGVFSLGLSPGGGYWHNTPGTNYEPYVYFPDMGLNFPRLALWGKFRWRATGQEFLFYTTHYDFNSTPQVESATLMIRDALARSNLIPLSPLAIVVGDFNSSQNDDDWRLFTGSYTNSGVSGDFSDSWYEVHGDWTDSGTFHSFTGSTISGASRIDWILHRGGLTATQAVIVTDSTVSTNTVGGGWHTMFPSDHYPVYADLLLPEPATDYDRDGLPDFMEMSSTSSLPADPDTDHDLLVDGEEDLNGDGLLQGGETNPNEATSTQNPTDIRHFQMDGIRDYRSTLLSSDGMQLHWRFDGRYLYVATADAGEGSDHFVFVAGDPGDAVSAPWAKKGLVARWDAFLADENDPGRFSGWFDANGLITNQFFARSATYYDDSSGSLEGVIDLSQIYGAGFTSAFYLAAAPYATTNGGHLWSAAQAPAGDGNDDLLGDAEYIEINPGDLDGDGINDRADPDRDGDGLPDTWERAYGIDSASVVGNDGASGDSDHDGASHQDELRACTHPDDGDSVFKILGVTGPTSTHALSWPATHEKVYTAWRAPAAGLSNEMSWSCFYTNASNTNFPVRTNTVQVPLGTASSAFYHLRVRD